MRRTIKYSLVFCVFFIAATGIFVWQFPLHSELEKRIAAQLSAQGLSQVEISIAQVGKQHILFSHIAFAKDKMRVVVEDVNIVATALPIVELLRGHYANVAADWSIGNLEISGIPYPLPSLSGAGKLRADAVSGRLYDATHQYESSFVVTPEIVTLRDLHAPWQGAKVSAQEVRIALGGNQPISIPLHIDNLPLTVLLSMISSDKASGTGWVSGNVELIIFSDGHFDLGGGKFSTASHGIIQLSENALPGAGEQMELARKALSNLHYKDLKLTLSHDHQGKLLIRLNIEGNNPDALEGRPVKLNVNLSGDMLELLQQTLLPMESPASLIEKEHP